jgi:hypothetical protein
MEPSDDELTCEKKEGLKDLGPLSGGPCDVSRKSWLIRIRKKKGKKSSVRRRHCLGPLVPI